MAIAKNIVKKTTNVYLRQYFVAHNLKDGDEWDAVSYMNWIEAMHDEFRKKYCLIPDVPYPKEEQDLFIDWLSEKAKNV